MNFNTFMTHFPFILLLLTIASGLIWLADHLFFAKERTALPDNDSAKKMPWLADYAKAFFPVFLIVMIIRSFIAQPYSVPTQSLEPTVRPGDLLLVTQYSYGLKIPVWDKTIIPISKPQHGDIAVFNWPVNPRISFVKRVIGIPGDHVSYIHNILTVNGHVAHQTYVGKGTDSDSPAGPFWPVKIMREDFMGVKHLIYLCGGKATLCPAGPSQDFKDLVIPKGEYLMIGDNRVNSDDSRDWGFVPVQNIMGKAQIILYSKKHDGHGIDFSRIGKRLNPHFFKSLFLLGS